MSGTIGALPNQWDLDQKQLERKRALAQALQSQSQDMGPAGQMVSGWYVPTNSMSYLAKALQGALGTYQQGALDREEKESAQKRQGALADTIKEFTTAAQGRAAEALPAGVQGPPAPAIPPDKNAALAALLRNPDTAQAAMQQQLAQLFAGNKFSTTPHYDQQGRAFVLSESGQPKYLEGISARDKMDVGPSGQVFNPYEIKPGQVLADVNKPFMMAPNGGGAVPNTPYQAYEMSRSRASAPSISVRNDIKTGESIAKEIGPMVAKSKASADSAVNQMNIANRIDSAIKSGKVITGPAANQRLAISQIGEVLGVSGKNNQETLSNTRTVVQGLAQFSLEGRSLLKGQGQVSDYEGKLLQKAVSGDISDLTIPELKVITGTARRVADAQYKEHKRIMGVMEARPDLQGMSEFYKPADMPAQPAGKASQSPKFLGFE